MAWWLGRASWLLLARRLGLASSRLGLACGLGLGSRLGLAHRLGLGSRLGLDLAVGVSASIRSPLYSCGLKGSAVIN